MLPVIFIHRGRQKYLKYVLEQAVKMNNEVFLLGGSENETIANVKWHNSETLSRDYYLEFKKAYKHMSTNSLQFELFCFERYFLLYEFMKLMNIKYCIQCDSDVMIYIDFNNVNIDFSKYDIMYSGKEAQKEYEWAYFPHCSYWTIESLEKFIKYILDIYNNNLNILEEKWDYHVRNNVPGGVCDMTLLYLYINNKKELRTLNSFSIENMVFDENFSSSQGANGDDKYVFDRTFNCKKVRFIDGIPYFYIKNTKQKVRAYIIHAQGGTKRYIPCFYEGMDPKVFYNWTIFKCAFRNIIRTKILRKHKD